jgi:hypothetical protein
VPGAAVVSSRSVTCPKCGEEQLADNVRCARCGSSLETTDQRKERLAALEQSRREAERDSVSIQRLPGFGINGPREESFGTRQYFATTSNQRRRRLAIVVVAFVIGMAFVWSH